MNIAQFNARGPNNGIEYWFDLIHDELISQGHNVRQFWLRGKQPTREDIKWADFGLYHFSQVALYYRRLGIPFCILPSANDCFPDEGAKLKIAESHKNCKFITNQSHYHFLKYRQWKLTKPVVSVPMPARVNLFKRKTLYDPNGKIVAGGRLIPKKGLDTLKDVENLTVFGDGPLRKELERILPDSTTFTGNLDGKQLKELFEEASIYLFPAVVTPDGDSEGISNTIKEAQLMQLPVVSTPIAGNVEFKTIRFLTEWHRINEILKQPMIANKRGELVVRELFSPKLCVNKLIRGINEYI